MRNLVVALSLFYICPMAANVQDQLSYEAFIWVGWVENCDLGSL